MRHANECDATDARDTDENYPHVLTHAGRKSVRERDVYTGFPFPPMLSMPRYRKRYGDGVSFARRPNNIKFGVFGVPSCCRTSQVDANGNDCTMLYMFDLFLYYWAIQFEEFGEFSRKCVCIFRPIEMASEHRNHESSKPYHIQRA